MSQLAATGPKWEFTDCYFPTSTTVDASQVTTTPYSIAAKYLDPPISLAAINGSYSIADFARLFGQYLIQRSHLSSTSTSSPHSGLPYPPILLERILSATLDIEIDPSSPLHYRVSTGGTVTRLKWLEWLKRFGPMEVACQKASACLSIDGEPCSWFRVEQTRDSVDRFIKQQGEGFTALLRYKLSSSDDQVCSLSLPHGAHYQVFHRAEGYMYPGAKYYPNLRELIHSVHSELHGVDKNWGALAESIQVNESEWRMLDHCLTNWADIGRQSSGDEFVAVNWSRLTLSNLQQHHPSASIHTAFQSTSETIRTARTAFRRLVDTRRMINNRRSVVSNQSVPIMTGTSSTPSPYHSTLPTQTVLSPPQATTTTTIDVDLLSNRVSQLIEQFWCRLLSTLLEWFENDLKKLIDAVESLPKSPETRIETLGPSSPATINSTSISSTVGEIQLMRSKSVLSPSAASTPASTSHATSTQFHQKLSALDNSQLMELFHLLQEGMTSQLNDATRIFESMMERMESVSGRSIDYDVTRLQVMETRLYNSLAKLLQLFGLCVGRELPSSLQSTGFQDDSLFFYRFFDMDEAKISVSRFALALRIGLLQQHWLRTYEELIEQQQLSNIAITDPNCMKPKIPAPSIIQRILSVTADTDGGTTAAAAGGQSDGFIDYHEWCGFLSRFGPFHRCINKARSFCTATGAKADWYHPTATMSTADDLLNAPGSTMKFLVRLGRTPPLRAFVLVLKRDEHSPPVHIYIANSFSSVVGKQGYHIENVSPTADIKYHSDMIQLLLAVTRELQGQTCANVWSTKTTDLELEMDTYLDVRHPHPLRLLPNDSSNSSPSPTFQSTSTSLSLLGRPPELRCMECESVSSTGSRLYQCSRGCSFVICFNCLQDWTVQDAAHTITVGTTHTPTLESNDAETSHPASVDLNISGELPYLSSIVHPAALRPDDPMTQMTQSWYENAYASRSFAQARVRILEWLQFSKDPPPLLSWARLSVGDVTRFRIGGFSIVHCLVSNIMEAVTPTTNSLANTVTLADQWLAALVDLAKVGVPVHLPTAPTLDDDPTTGEPIPFEFLSKHQTSLVGVRPIKLALMQCRAIQLQSGHLSAAQHFVSLLTARRQYCLRLVRIFLSYPFGVGSSSMTPAAYLQVYLDLLRESIRQGLDRITHTILEPFQIITKSDSSGTRRMSEFGPHSGCSLTTTFTPADSEREQMNELFLRTLHSTDSCTMFLKENSQEGIPGEKTVAITGSILHVMASTSAARFKVELFEQLNTDKIDKISALVAGIDGEVVRVSESMPIMLEDLLHTFKTNKDKLNFLSANTSSHHSATYLAAVNLNLHLFDALVFHPEYSLHCNQHGTLLHSICRRWSSHDLADRLERLNQRSFLRQQVLETPASLSDSMDHVPPVRAFSTPIMRAHSGIKAKLQPLTSPKSSSASSSSSPDVSPDGDWDLTIKLNSLNSHGQTALELLILDLFPTSSNLAESESTTPHVRDSYQAVDHDRKRSMILFLIERGARLPTDLSKSQLLQISTLLFTAMRRDSSLRYSIPERAIKNGDVALFSLIFKPILDRQSCVPPVVELYNRDTKRIESLLLLACSLDRCVDEDGMEQRHPRIVELLINYKPSVQYKHHEAATPATIQVHGHRPSAQFTIEEGTSTHPTSSSSTSSSYSSDRINYNLEDSNGSRRNALHLIIGDVTTDLQSLKHCTEITQLLLGTRQFDLMATDSTGCNVLHLAAKNGLIQVVDLLISEHIALDARTLSRSHSGSALHIAAEQGNWQIVISLLQAGAALNALDGKGETSLTKAMLAKRTLEDEIERRDMREEDEPIDSTDEEENRTKESFSSSSLVESDLTDADLHHLLVRYQRTTVELLKAGASITESCEHSPDHTVDCLVNIKGEFMKIHQRILAQSEEDEEDKEEAMEELDEEDSDQSYSSAGSDPDSIFTLKLTQIVMNELYELHVKSRHIARLIRFLMTLILLTFVCVYSNTQDKKSAFFLTQSVKNQFGNDAFQGIGSTGDIWSWTKESLRDSIYPEDAPLAINSSSAEGGFHQRTPFVLGQNHLVGLVQLRQVRTNEERYCPGSGSTEEGEVECYPFHTASDLHGASWSGNYDSYPGSGFVVHLPPSDSQGRNASLEVLNHLDEIHWIDAITRALFIEFTLFNSHENHFVVVTLLVELPPTGGCLPSADFSIHKLVRYVSWGDYVLLTFQLLLLILLAAYFFTEFQEIRFQGIWQYVQTFYNTMDLTLFMLTVTIVSLHLYGMTLSASLNWLTTTEYVPVQKLASVLWWHGQLSSILVFIAWLKLIEFFSVFKDISRLTVMIEMVAEKMIPFFVVLLISLFAFASAEYIAYGYKSETSYTWFFSLLSAITRTFSYDANLENFEFMKSFYSIMFAISICLIMLNLVVAILNSAYEDALQDSGDSYWAKRQYGMIVNTLYKKKQGTLNRYDQALEVLVSYVSELDLSFSLPSSSTTSSDAASKLSQISLTDLDESSTSSHSSSITSFSRPHTRRHRPPRIGHISTAPDWMKLLPTPWEFDKDSRCNEIDQIDSTSNSFGVVPPAPRLVGIEPNPGPTWFDDRFNSLRRLVHRRLQPDPNTRLRHLSSQPYVIISCIGEFLSDKEAIRFGQCCHHILASLQSRYACKRAFELDELIDHLHPVATLPLSPAAGTSAATGSRSTYNLGSRRFGDVSRLWLSHPNPQQLHGSDSNESDLDSWREQFSRLCTADRNHEPAASIPRVHIAHISFSFDWVASLQSVAWPTTVHYMRFFYCRGNSNVDGSPDLDLTNLSWPTILLTLQIDRGWSGSIRDLNLPDTLRHLTLVNPNRQSLRLLQLPHSLVSFTICYPTKPIGSRDGFDINLIESIPAVLPPSLIRLCLGFDLSTEMRANIIRDRPFQSPPLELRTNVKNLSYELPAPACQTTNCTIQ